MFNLAISFSDDMNAFRNVYCTGLKTGNTEILSQLKTFLFAIFRKMHPGLKNVYDYIFVMKQVIL